MKTNFIKNVLLFICLLELISCVRLDTVSLKEKEESNIPFEVGNVSIKLLESFGDGALIDWWQSSNTTMIIEDYRTTMRIQSKGMGPGFDCFGRVNYKPIDLAATPIIKVRARAVGDQAPKFRVCPSDGVLASGGKDNIVPLDNEKFYDLYYDFSGKVFQFYPKKAQVNKSAIVGITYFIAPGAAPFFGEIYIDDIVALPLDSLKDEYGMYTPIGTIDNFRRPSLWWKNSEKIELEKEDGIQPLVASVKEVGMNNEQMGRSFKAIDFYEYPKLLIKAKIESKEAIELDIFLTDKNGNRTLVEKISIQPGEDFKDYLVDYTNKLDSANKDGTLVLGDEITEMIIGFGKGKSNTGKIYFKEIRALKTIN